MNNKINFSELQTKLDSKLSLDSELDKLLHVMQILRTPETGCPWDLKQTFETIIPYILEEAYEVKEAVINHDMQGLREELGDLLFQIVFFSQIAQENALFSFDDICKTITEKLIRRHPHVEALQILATSKDTHIPDSVKSLTQQSIAAAKTAISEDTSQITKNWEAIKQHERESKSQHSLMDDIPQSLPALMRAHKIQNRCKSVGFDWDNWRDVFAKVKEEVDEVETELAQATESEIDETKLAEELGDLMFAITNLTRHLGFKSEEVLDQANRKFMRRFRQVESGLKAQNIPLETASLNEMERLWQQVKQNEKQNIPN